MGDSQAADDRAAAEAARQAAIEAAAAAALAKWYADHRPDKGKP